MGAIRLSSIVLAAVLAVGRVGPVRAGPELRRYETPYYLVYTDLEPADAAEAVVRLKVLAEALRKGTRELGFTGRIERRLPVYLCKNREDYLATGAPPESAGAFLGDRLVVAASDRAGAAPAWNVIQHEAFHQFAAAVKGPELPGWVAEGLGEYFGEGLWTGDGLVTGVVPAWRAARVKKSLADGSFPPLQHLLRMSQQQWNEKVTVSNYDQAWSVVQFILHGRGDDADGKSLAGFLRALAGGQAVEEARREAFGDAGDFERRWRAYWQSLPSEPTSDRYAQAAAATVTSFVARAAAVGKPFETFDALLAAAKQDQLPCSPDEWLPPSLLHRALGWAQKQSAWRVGKIGDGTCVVLTALNGTRWIGTYALRERRVREVTVRREDQR